MSKLLMPKATAVWLVENTTLSFDQIATFCELHPLEVQGIADGDVASGILGQDPVVSNQLTREEIKRCEKDPKTELQLTRSAQEFYERNRRKVKKARYTPVARRQDKPDAIAWIIKNCPEMPDSVIVKLVGTTKKTIEAIRTKTHWNWSNITPRDPVLVGLCTQVELDKTVAKINMNKEKEAEASEAPKEASAGE